MAPPVEDSRSFFKILVGSDPHGIADTTQESIDSKYEELQQLLIDGKLVIETKEPQLLRSIDRLEFIKDDCVRFISDLQRKIMDEKLADRTTINDGLERIKNLNPGRRGIDLSMIVKYGINVVAIQSVRIFIGPKIPKEGRHDSARLNIYASKIEEVNIPPSYLVNTYALATKEGKEQVDIVVVGTRGISEADIRKKIESVIGAEDVFNDVIANKLGLQSQNEKHSALMGGIGISAGYHYHTKNFIFNLRAGADHIWGKFRQTGPQHMDTENMPRLGWGIPISAGIDYKFTPKSTIGLEGGIRLSEFKIPKKNKPQSTNSSWFMAPFAQVVCGFYPHPDYSISVFTGYFFPRTFEVKTKDTRIPEGTKCKIDGLFGGLRFARYF